MTKKLQLTLPFVQRENAELMVSDVCQLCKVDIRKRRGHLGSRRIHIYKYHLKVSRRFIANVLSNFLILLSKNEASEKQRIAKFIKVIISMAYAISILTCCTSN